MEICQISCAMRGVFPFAGAKVRQLSRLAKYSGNFFQNICKKGVKRGIKGSEKWVKRELKGSERELNGSERDECPVGEWS